MQLLGTQLLVRAKQRGVEVKLIADKTSPCERAGGIEPLARAGVAIWIDRGVKIGHVKAMVIDRKVVLAGSMNWTANAGRNSEDRNLVRITAQLIDAETGHHLWADRYDRDLADVFAVQDEIAQSITGAMAPGIISAEIRHAQQKDPTRLDAWDRIMRALWHIRRFTQDDLAEARRLLTEAIDLDPTNAMAFSDLAFLRHFQAVFGWGESIAEAHAGAGEAARKAVSLDDGDATAHTVLAIYEMFSGRHEEARRRLRRALDLDPNCAFAHGYIGVSHAFAGERDAVLRHCDEALRLSPRDPLLLLWYLPKGWAALNAERYEEAIEFAILAAEAHPEFPDVYAVRAAAEGHLGRVDAGRSTLEELLRRMPALTVADERLNRPFARAADRERFLIGLRKAGLPEG